MLIAEQSTVTGLATVQAISDVSAFAALREEWTRLLVSNKSNCLFLTWEWLFTWWRHLADGRRLLLLTVRMDGDLVGIAPLAVSPRFRFGYALETLEFLGCGHVGSDYLDIIAAEGSEEVVVRELRAYLARRRYAIRWSNVKPESLAAGLARQLKSFQWSLAEAQTNVSPYIPLSGMTWESYLATLGSEHRYGFRRKCQRLNREYAVAWEQPANVAECLRSHRLDHRAEQPAMD